MTVMILATVSTRNYDFAVVAQDKIAADLALLKAWREHARQTGADPALMHEMIVEGEVSYTPIALGQVLRDGAPLSGPVDGRP